MKKFMILVVALSLLLKSVSGQYSLEIEIAGLRSNNGLIMLQLFDEKNKLISQVKGIIADKKSITMIKDLRPGKYAFRYYHDENLSELMETNRLGIPKEGYGFSNNAYGPFGPKPFTEWLFEINEDKKMAAKTKY